MRNIMRCEELLIQGGKQIQALVFSRNLTPSEITPARALAVDFAAAHDLSEAIFEARQGNPAVDVGVTVVGYSADLDYLSEHRNANVVFGDYDGLTTEADISPGSSGGPVFFAPVAAQSIGLTQSGEPVLIAINSTLNPGGETARHSYLNKNSLYTVPFLHDVEDGNNEYCTQTADIVADNLNMRVGSGVWFQKLAIAEERETSALFSGDSVQVFGTTTNELGQEWALVQTDEGRTGYVSNNPDYLQWNVPFCLRL